MSISQKNNVKVASNVFDELCKELSQAADTIEALSAKLQAIKYEQSCSCNSEWIDFNDKVPENEQNVLISKNGETLEALFEFSLPDENCEDSELLGFVDGWCGGYDGFAILKNNEDDAFWQPLPEPYKPQ